MMFVLGFIFGIFITSAVLVSVVCCHQSGKLFREEEAYMASLQLDTE